MTDEPHGQLWHRNAELVGVNFPDRTIELVVMPYETETLVGYDGRMVTEVISRGAFDGIERRANRIRANRDHDETRTFGRALALHPSREDGLVAELKVARTPLGDETLELAEDGCLDASAGFLPMAGGMTWETRSSYRVSKAWLGHIAMVPDPAYETAKVLSVRSVGEQQPSSTTPHLDRVRAWRLHDLVASDTALNR
jgi:HK97 family phage prohead protease